MVFEAYSGAAICASARVGTGTYARNGRRAVDLGIDQAVLVFYAPNRSYWLAPDGEIIAKNEGAVSNQAASPVIDAMNKALL